MEEKVNVIVNLSDTLRIVRLNELNLTYQDFREVKGKDKDGKVSIRNVWMNNGFYSTESDAIRGALRFAGKKDNNSYDSLESYLTARAKSINGIVDYIKEVEMG